MFPDTCIIGKKNYFICTDTSIKDGNIYLPKLLFIGISKKWDPRHGKLNGIRDPRLQTHLKDEIRKPRSETLNVRHKSWDSHRASDTTLIVRESQDHEIVNWDLRPRTLVMLVICYPGPLSEPNKGYCNKISKIFFFQCRGPRSEFRGSRKICLNGSSEWKTEGRRM